MALATTPILNGMVRPACKRRIEKPAVVVIDDTRPSAGTYHKQSLSILMDINEKRATMFNDTDRGQMMKIAGAISCDKDSSNIFQTFCGLSFLDRYQNKATIAWAMRDLDRHIPKFSWQMEDQLNSKCIQLLVRMGTIENLSSLDADLICLLCSLCKSHGQSATYFDLLLEIGRSVWPYLKRPLWHSEPFVDFVADIFEAIGGKLEELYPKNFNVAWKEILTNLVSSQDKMSNYSRLRLLAVIEHRHRGWHLPSEVTEFFREQYNEFTDTRKKEILAFLGFLSSRRKTSLTANPGRSAADFLKRRQSQESQENDEGCSTSSSGDGSEALSDVNEEILEQNESDSVFSPVSLTDTCRNTFFENIQEPETCEHPNVASDFDGKIIKSDDPLLESNQINIDIKDNVKEDFCDIEKNDEHNSGGHKRECEIERQGENMVMRKDEMKEDIENAEMKYKQEISERRSFLLDRKKETIKVPKKYVGRVIGSQGSVIQSIQEESDARVNIVRKGKVLVARSKFSTSTVKNIIRNTLGFKMEKSSRADDDSTEKDNSQKSKGENNENDDEDEAFEFQIIGTDEGIKKAKRKIDSIISYAKRSESHANLKRSLSDGDEVNFNSFRRSFHQDRKKVIMKVGGKYVGRVIGSGGGMIMTIEEESGAKVTFIKDKRTEQNRYLKQERDQGLKNESETWFEAVEQWKKEQTKETQRGDTANYEYDFEIVGTDETINKAKEKIEFIMKLVDDGEKKSLTRSHSCSAPRSGFKRLHRTLSCPITDWGQSCDGECLNCAKGCYCRSFLLQQSKSRFSWVRPEVLALNQDVKWAELIVEKEVDESSWRPRTLSDETCINFESGEDLSSGRTSPENPQADNISYGTSTENTHKYFERKTTFEDSSIFEDARKQVNGDLSSSKQVNEELSSPKQVNEELSSPKQVNKELSSPKQVNEDLSSSKEVNEELSSSKYDSKELSLPKQINKEVSLTKQANKEVSLPKQVNR